jgi:hypothetical protein
MTGLRAGIVAFCLGLLIVSSVQALSVVDASDEQLTDKAEWIVMGKVLSAHSEKDFGNGEIFTYISVRVTDVVKGKLSSRDIVLKTLGGRSGDDIVYIPGAADFFRNEEVFLFLERRSDGSLMPIGLMLGKYSVYRDSQTGKKVVLRHTDGNGQYFSAPREETIHVEPKERIFLNDFRSRIHEIVRSRR